MSMFKIESFRLTLRSLLTGVFLATGGVVFQPAKADSCASLKKQLHKAVTKKKEAIAYAKDLADQYNANPNGNIRVIDVNNARNQTRKYEQKIFAIAKKTENCTPP